MEENFKILLQIKLFGIFLPVQYKKTLRFVA